MSASLVEKYAEARLPRYTSYPTAPQFTTAVDADTYAGWLAALAPDQPVSLYLHVPFCRAMCWYCGCHTTITARDRPILDYLEALREEIRLIAEHARAPLPVRHVHFGGGTPTIVTPEDFLELTDLLHEAFDVDPLAEIAVEIDPRTLTGLMADALAAAGVNRASLGVQSFDPVVQKAVNRIQDQTMVAGTVDALRSRGIDQINFDLIYGLPHQTVRSCIETAETAAAMRPDRLAVFGYAHVPAFKKHQRMIDESALPDGAERNAQAAAIAETLIRAGYEQIGLDHFALPGDELARAARAGILRRNFQGYTTDACDTLIGLGASAIGRTAQGYVQNEVPVGLYARRIADGKLATAKGYRLTREDRMRAEIIERLMCDMAVDVGAIATRHGFDPTELLEKNARLAVLRDEGLVTLSDGRVTMADSHRFLVRVIAAAFDAYLDQSARRFAKAA